MRPRSRCLTTVHKEILNDVVSNHMPGFNEKSSSKLKGALLSLIFDTLFLFCFLLYNAINPVPNKLIFWLSYFKIKK